MLRALEWIKRNKSYFKNFLKILIATSASQLILISATPFLSRIYSTSDFGAQGVLFSVVSILTFLSTLRYENILIIERREKPIFLFTLVLKLLLRSIICIFLLLLAFNSIIPGLIGLGSDNKNLLFFIPVILFFNSLYDLFILYKNRLNDFNFISKLKVSQSLISSTSQLILGTFGTGALGLILGPVISKASLTIKSLPTNRLFSRFTEKEKSLFKFHYKFPIYDVPNNLINTIIQYIPILFFGAYNKIELSGAYFMSMRIIQSPVSILSHSILEVYKSKISEITSYDLRKKVFYDTTALILILTLLPFAFSFFYVEEILIYFLGESWYYTAAFTKILLPSLYLKLYSYPLSYIIISKNKQNVSLYINFITISFIAIALLLNKNLLPTEFVQLVNIVFCFKSIVIIAYSAYLIHRK